MLLFRAAQPLKEARKSSVVTSSGLVMRYAQCSITMVIQATRDGPIVIVWGRRISGPHRGDTNEVADLSARIRASTRVYVEPWAVSLAGLAEDLSEAPHLVERVIERDRRRADHVWGAKVADDARFLQAGAQGLRVASGQE